jgi:hypothetical protein
MGRRIGAGAVRISSIASLLLFDSDEIQTYGYNRDLGFSYKEPKTDGGISGSRADRKASNKTCENGLRVFALLSARDTHSTQELKGNL